MTMSATADRPSSAQLFDPLSLEFLRDPYPAFASLRQTDPVFWSDTLNGWVLTKYDDVKTGMDMSVDFVRPFAEDFRARRGHSDDVADLGRLVGEWTSFFDTPEHTRLRTILNQVVNRVTVEAIRPRIVAIAEQLASNLARRDKADLAVQFSNLLPVMVVGEMLGITSERDCLLLMKWSDDLHLFVGQAMRSRGKYARSAAAARNLDAFFRSEIESRRARPRDDGISRLMETGRSGNRLSDDELAANCTMLFYAGHETTAGLISLALMALSRNKDQLRKLKTRPELLPAACEEFFRYDGPVQAMVRTAKADYVMRGKKIRAGDRIYPFINAANRDPEIFSDPDVLDIERTDNRHMVFGHGVHFCIGSALARAEAPAALNALLPKLADLDFLEEELEMRDSLAFRAPSTLTMHFEWAA